MNTSKQPINVHMASMRDRDPGPPSAARRERRTERRVSSAHAGSGSQRGTGLGGTSEVATPPVRRNRKTAGDTSLFLAPASSFLTVKLDARRLFLNEVSAEGATLGSFHK